MYHKLIYIYAYTHRWCIYKVEIISIDRETLTTNATKQNDNAHLRLFRSFVVILYAYRVCKYNTVHATFKVHFMKVITKVHRTEYFASASAASVCLNSFSSTGHQISTIPISLARIVCMRVYVPTYIHTYIQHISVRPARPFLFYSASPFLACPEFVFRR